MAQQRYLLEGEAGYQPRVEVQQDTDRELVVRYESPTMEQMRAWHRRFGETVVRQAWYTDNSKEL